MSETITAEAETLLSVSVSDIIILAAVLVGGGYYLLRKKKKVSYDFDSELLSTYPIEQVRLARSQSVTESGFIGNLKSSNTNIAIFYGSQTGTAEEYSNRIAKEATRFQMKAKVFDPEECTMEKLSLLPEMIENHLVIFVVATYGEGDPTDNNKQLFEMLEEGSQSFQGVKYAVFALGNKTYEHYNAAGIYIDKRLEELGGKRVCEIGLGDDDGNIEEHFVTWKELLWSAVCEQYGVEPTSETGDTRQFKFTEHQPSEISDDEIFKGEVTPKPRSQYDPTKVTMYDAKNPLLAKVTVNRDLYKGERVCMHIEVDIKNTSIKYEAGDHLAVYCRSDKNLVNKIGELLNVDLDTIITMEPLDSESSKQKLFPCPTSYRTALTYYVDVNQQPTTYILKELAEYTDNEEHKQLLKKMSTYNDEGKALYAQFIVSSCRNIVHVLEDLPSVKPPIDHLVELLPRLQPRFYSISSSPRVHPTSVHITAVLVKYNQPDNNNREINGVCTTYLQSQTAGVDGSNGVIPCYLRKSQFRLPPKPETPMIMIGPGTGLAPFRGFIQERDWCRRDGRPIGSTILYFGCRKRDEDYLYKEELESYLENGTLSKLYVAFSRDQPEKVYVTHLLRQNKDEVWDVIGNKGGHVYVCGDAKNMARNVKDILLEIIQEKGNKSQAEAQAFLKKMESARKYAADVWS